MIYVGIIVVCLIFFSIVYATTKNKKPFRRAFLSMVLGVASLIVANIAGKYIGVTIPISPLSITVSACGGIPAVAAMVLISNFV
ncbi:MAG: pro-sigmaK processing inhibitor BofA family protein [Clostridia bacterium]|nr:pro-sigmaK processing inhibitor BofA family protein [Clostridia bacterium]